MSIMMFDYKQYEIATVNGDCGRLVGEYFQDVIGRTKVFPVP